MKSIYPISAGIFLFLIQGIFHTATGQYYYKDIFSNQLTANEQNSLKKAGIKKITLTSLDENGEPKKDFFCEKKISKDYQRNTIHTRTVIDGKSLMVIEFNTKGYPIQVYDSSEHLIKKTVYTYQHDTLPMSITTESTSRDDDFVNHNKEEHIYQYSSSGKLESLDVFIRGKSSNTVLFATDEEGRIAVEKNLVTGLIYYYYYDENNRLTDIVHYSDVLGKMVLDYELTYEENGNITRQITTERGKNNFVVWKFEYEGSLKKTEDMYTKEGELLGSIQYEYR